MSSESSGNMNAVTRCIKRSQSVKMSTEKESKENSSTTNDENQRNKRPWSNRDKCQLLHALKRYGHTDIVNISRTLRNKSPTAIKAMISKYMTSSRKMRDLQSPINDWLQCGMFLQTDTLIPQALKFIELFEKHPLPNQAADCDFRSAYNFLHRMVLGYRPINAPPNTMRIVNYLLSKVIKEVWPAYKKEALVYFGYIGSKRKLNISKVYPGKKHLANPPSWIEKNTKDLAVSFFRELEIFSDLSIVHYLFSEKLKEKLERPSHEFKNDLSENWLE